MTTLEDLIKTRKVSRTGDENHIHWIAIDCLNDLLSRLNSAESELSTLRAELDNAALQIKFRDGLIESKNEYIALMEAELDKPKEQKPFGYFVDVEYCGFTKTKPDMRTFNSESVTALYAHPVPPQQVPDDLIAALEQIVHATSDSHSDGAYHENAYFIATQALKKYASTTPPSDEAK